VFPVCYYKKAEAEVKTGDKVMPVYVDYEGVIHCYTMEGGKLSAGTESVKPLPPV
jgi:hypothetical protein